MPSRKPDQLAAARSLGCFYRRPGQGTVIVVADEDEQWASHLCRKATRPVEHEAQGRAGGDDLTPVGVFAVGVEGTVPVLGIGGREHSGGPWLANERH